MRTNKHARACARTNTQTLHLPNILRLPLHVLHGGVCVGLWKQLGLIIDVLHFNQFHHSVRLIKVSAMLPGAVYVWGCEWIKKKSVCEMDGICVFSCSWGLHAPFYISKYMGILYFRNKRWETVLFSLSCMRALACCFSSSLSLILCVSLSCSLLPLSLPRQDPKCN